jgi:hypothetical protein
MERRYLAATIAMAATFALFSHAFGSGMLNRVHDPRATLISEMHCAAQSLRARMLEKVNRSLGANAEEAQLRVELNLPASPATPAAPAAPAIAPVAPEAPEAPMAPVQTAAAHAELACPTQRLVHDVSFAQNFNSKMQAKMVALQSRLLARQAKLQAKLAVQQERVNARIQREASRVARAQARASLAQAKLSTRACNGNPAVYATSGDGDMDINVDVDQLSNQIEEQVTRSLRSTVRTF